MLELIVIVILSGVFWRYGKEMGSGKWIMIITFIGCYIGIAMVIPIIFVPVIGSAILTSILGICLSVMSDRKRLKSKDNNSIQTSSVKANKCTKCNSNFQNGQVRCFGCGLSLAKVQGNF